MPQKQNKYSGWALYPKIEGSLVAPEHLDAVRASIIAKDTVIARGNGRSYGDAALGENLISTMKLNKIKHFDHENGQITCEAGVLFSDILALIVPKGWFFMVTPGTAQITVGGAIACDVHGKNHSDSGCFSQHLIQFDLITSTGEVVTCSKSENQTLFWQTCGGMGWTGVILHASFQLKRINSVYMHQTTLHFDQNSVEPILNTLRNQQTDDYAAAWLDLSSKSLRGLVFLNHHDTTPTELRYTPSSGALSVPFLLPFSVINKWSIKAYNAYYFFKNKPRKQRISLNTCFYPLDGIQDWNRLYGPRGFVQYQFCIPDAQANAGMISIIRAIRNSGEIPFLCVLKRHGERSPESIHSFPIKGFSLALDFPRTTTIFTLIQQLDKIVWDQGGKIYLAKDACSAPHMGRIDPNSFGNHKFSSALKQRIL